MKAKFIYESLADALLPKSSDELNKSFSAMGNTIMQLSYALKYNLINKVKELVDKDPDILKHLQPLGHLMGNAVSNKYYELVEYLLQNKDVIKYLDKNGYEGILIYEARNDREMIRLLNKYFLNIKESVHSVLNPKSKEEIIKNCDLNPKVIEYLIKNGWVFTEKWTPRNHVYYVFEKNGANIAVSKYDDITGLKRFISDTHL